MIRYHKDHMLQAEPMLIPVLHTHWGSPWTLFKALTKLRVSIQNSSAELKESNGVWVWPECVNKFVALFRLCIIRSDFLLITTQTLTINHRLKSQAHAKIWICSFLVTSLEIRIFLIGVWEFLIKQITGFLNYKLDFLRQDLYMIYWMFSCTAWEKYQVLGSSCCWYNINALFLLVCEDLST